jgi:hypothetical protein
LARFGDVVGDEARGEQVYRQILESMPASLLFQLTEKASPSGMQRQRRIIQLEQRILDSIDVDGRWL